MQDLRASITVNGPSTISLSFREDIGGAVRSRMAYTFRVFASIYNYRVVESNFQNPNYSCIYARSLPHSLQPGTLYIPARYRSGFVGSRIKQLTKESFAGEEVWLAFGSDAETGDPDWLGEAFMWLSCGYEIGDGTTDSVGRIPYSETIFGRFGINPRKPYASILMAWMEQSLRKGKRDEAPKRPPTPIESAEHIVLPSHDIDYCHTSLASSCMRLSKNFLISATAYGSARFFADTARQSWRLLQGKRIGDYLPALMQEIETRGFRSTFFAVARHGHRRDPNYRLTAIAGSLRSAKDKGFSIGVHGSYCSVFESATLPGETQELARELGQYPLGSRQHWLRFDGYERLFRELGRAGLRFDSSLGFPEHAGFRNGAAFPFPPYDFGREAPFDFLEFPLVLMDGALEVECRNSHDNPQEIADEVLAESRRWGWGGISILWHNPLEPLQVPSSINSVFWNCAERRDASREAWISADQFFESCLGRFQNAGLLTTVRANA